MKAISLIKPALSHDDYCEFLSNADSFKRVHVQSVPKKYRYANFANAHIKCGYEWPWISKQMTRSKVTVFPQYFELYRKFSVRDWLFLGSRECLLASDIYRKLFPRTIKARYLQNHESAMKSQYSESLLSVDLEEYILHSTMANCPISRHIIQRAFVLCKTTTRNARMSRAIVRTNHIHKANYLSLLQTCRRSYWHNAMSECDMDHLVFAYNINYIEIGFGANIQHKY